MPAIFSDVTYDSVSCMRRICSGTISNPGAASARAHNSHQMEPILHCRKLVRSRQSRQLTRTAPFWRCSS